jgi:ribonuclease J
VGPESLRDGGPSGAGLVYIDGIGIGDVEQVVLRDRQLLSQDGVLIVTVTVERDTGRVRTPPQAISRGVIAPESAEELEEAASEAAALALRGSVDRDDLAVLRERVHTAVARAVHQRVGRRPLVMPIITEV